MHDWTLLSIVFEWKKGQVTLAFRGSDSQPVSVIAESVSRLEVPKLDEWGPSVSVNEVRGPTGEMAGYKKVEIEIQSGDVIKITAKSFSFPSRA